MPAVPDIALLCHDAGWAVAFPKSFKRTFIMQSKLSNQNRRRLWPWVVGAGQW